MALIGCGSWGRELLGALGRLNSKEIPIDPQIVAICDNYPAAMRKASTFAPKAKQVEDYKTILADPEVQAVVIAYECGLVRPGSG